MRMLCKRVDRQKKYNARINVVGHWPENTASVEFYVGAMHKP
jgi:hypothetical protein